MTAPLSTMDRLLPAMRVAVRMTEARLAGLLPGRHRLVETPVAVVPSSSAVAVKAGGVATLTGGDTTQPETQR